MYLSFSCWQANVAGRNEKNVKEFLEKQYEDDLDADGVVRLAIRALLEVKRRLASFDC